MYIYLYAQTHISAYICTNTLTCVFFTSNDIGINLKRLLNVI